MENIKDYKELNKPIIAKIMETLEKFPDPEVQAKGIEILIEYDDRGIIKHDVARYWKNNSGHWLGTVGSLFDFDFYLRYIHYHSYSNSYKNNFQRQ